MLDSASDLHVSAHIAEYVHCWILLLLSRSVLFVGILVLCCCNEYEEDELLLLLGIMC